MLKIKPRKMINRKEEVNGTEERTRIGKEKRKIL